MIGYNNDKFIIKKVVAGKENDSEILFFHLSNGIVNVVACNYGCTIVAVEMPDRLGRSENIAAGFNSFDDYKNDQHYLGCTVGRFANRIAFGKFKINDRQHHLECNNGVNHLHGGANGFHKKIWKAAEGNNNLSMHYFSKDGEEGYPGNLNVEVKFSFDEQNKFIIEYKAVTDKPTIINLTNHSYFNLSGFNDSTICGHLLKINAKNYTEKNVNNIPSGKILPVAGTAYDFRKSKSLGKDMASLTTDMGYDINYVLDKTMLKYEQPAAELYHPGSGRLLRLFTDAPGLQVYTANWWDGAQRGAQGKLYQKHGAVALETQSFPDAPNHPEFPNTILNPSETYSAKTIFQFLIL